MRTSEQATSASAADGSPRVVLNAPLNHTKSSSHCEDWAVTASSNSSECEAGAVDESLRLEGAAGTCSVREAATSSNFTECEVEAMGESLRIEGAADICSRTAGSWGSTGEGTRMTS